MGILELFLTAVGLSMDTFAVGACAGLTMPKVTVKKSVIVGLYFGIFQGIMPLIGYFLATWFADKIVSFDHWIAFALLVFIGGKMIVGSIRESRGEKTSEEPPSETSLSPSKMLPLAIATSIDALAIGVSFAFLKTGIIMAVSFIAVTTFVLSVAGVKLGNMFGIKFKSKAEISGGVILVLIGVKILLNHMGVISI